MRKSCLVSTFMIGASAHMPMYPSGGSNSENPIELGDITENSWAIATKIEPNEVHYYKFNIVDTTNGDPKNEQLWMGLYVPPGENEADFTYFTAIWGMPSDTKCTRWADGWGRRLDVRDEKHTHDSLAPKLVYPYDRKFVNDNSAIIVDRKAIPSRVVDQKEKDVLIFEASKEMTMPNKFEPFSPTVFRPRASCVAPFPKTGEYTIAIWAADGTKGTNHYSLGLGLKERDVFAF